MYTKLFSAYCFVVMIILHFTACNEIIEYEDKNNYISFTIDDNAVTTKGSIIENTVDMENFGVIACYDNTSIDIFTVDFMDNILVTQTSDNEWVYDPIQYWVDNNSLSFFGYSPYVNDDNGVEIGYNDEGISLAYTMPIDVMLQPDLMVSTPQTGMTSRNSPVEMKMQHVLTAIGFTVNGNGERVSKIGFKNIYTSGKLDITESSPAWSYINSSSSTYWAGIPSTGVLADSSGDLAINSSGYLMVLPQRLPEEALLVIEVDGEEKTVDIGGTEWVMGEKKIYDISFNSVWMLADFSATNYPSSDYWIIGDSFDTASSFIKYEGLFEALNTVSSTTDREITIEFINLETLVRDIVSSYTNYNSTCLKTLILSATTRIRKNAMSGCGTLTKIEMPLVERIEDEAFKDCIQLSEIYAPLVERIGDSAFMNIDALSSIDLPSATQLGDYVFSGCSTLNSISLPLAETIGEYAFMNCTQLRTIELSAVTSLGNGAFSSCRSLYRVSLPLLQIVNNNTFEYCSSLSIVNIPYAYSIGEYAFLSCSNLRTMELATASGAELNVVGSGAFYNAGISNTTLTVGDTCGEVSVSGNSLVCTSGTYKFYKIIEL